MKHTHAKGFTLIELLVVIAIIGILSSVILASLGAARSKARDAQRAANIQQVKNALELYHTDNGRYPATGTPPNYAAHTTTGAPWRGTCASYGSHGTSGATGYIPDLAPVYIATLPVDPAPSSTTCYMYNSNGNDYMFFMSDAVEGTVPAGLIRPLSPTAKTYAIYSPGAANW